METRGQSPVPADSGLRSIQAQVPLEYFGRTTDALNIHQHNRNIWASRVSDQPVNVAMQGDVRACYGDDAFVSSQFCTGSVDITRFDDLEPRLGRKSRFSQRTAKQVWGTANEQYLL